MCLYSLLVLPAAAFFATNLILPLYPSICILCWVVTLVSCAFCLLVLVCTDPKGGCWFCRFRFRGSSGWLLHGVRRCWWRVDRGPRWRSSTFVGWAPSFRFWPLRPIWILSVLRPILCASAVMNWCNVGTCVLCMSAFAIFALVRAFDYIILFPSFVS